MKKAGTLTIIPTPIDEESPLEQVAFQKINDAALSNKRAIFVIEEPRTGRRRWLHYKLPRDIIDHFVTYNEHNAKTCAYELINQLKSGRDIFLMSDAGLPAFCDPGIELINLCHQNKIKVTSTPFPNSVILALALSGLPHKQFLFMGFVAVKTPQRQQELTKILHEKRTTVLMDTPYRLKKLLQEFDLLMRQERCHKNIFLAMDLNSPDELLMRNTPAYLMQHIQNFKREFIMVI